MEKCRKTNKEWLANNEGRHAWKTFTYLQGSNKTGQRHGDLHLYACKILKRTAKRTVQRRAILQKLTCGKECISRGGVHNQRRTQIPHSALLLHVSNDRQPTFIKSNILVRIPLKPRNLFWAFSATALVVHNCEDHL